MKSVAAAQHQVPSDEVVAPQWLQKLDPSNPNLAKTLAEVDVLTINDLAVRIFLEETSPEDTPQKVPKNVREVYKKNFGDKPNPSLYGGHTLDDLLVAFRTLARGEHMSTSDLSEGMVHLGQGMSFREINRVLEEIDCGIADDANDGTLSSTRDSKISFVEYCRFMRTKLGGRKTPSCRGALKKLFDHYDRDKNGNLDVKEVKKLFSCLGIAGVEANKFIAEVDTNGDGSLSFDEIFAAINADVKEAVQQHEQNASSRVWKILKIWLQLSSGWEVAPKDPNERKSLTQNTNSKIVTFIRHGQSEGNLAADTVGTAKGVFNPDITPLGVQQARARGEQLKDRKFDLIVVSPMKRTLRTMQEVIGDGINKDVKKIGHPLAREQFSESDDVGDVPSKIKAEWPNVDWSLFPDAPEVWWYPGPNFTKEQLEKETCAAQRERNLKEDWEEPWEELMNRASAFESWLCQRPESEILCVTHGGFIEALVGPRMDNAQECVLRVANTPEEITKSEKKAEEARVNSK